MRYKKWLIENFEKSNTFEGELARQIKSDKTFPNTGNKKIIEKYLFGIGTTEKTMFAFYSTFRWY